MRIMRHVLLVPLLIGLLLLSCTDGDPNPVGKDDSDHPNDGLSVEYVGHTNYGCTGEIEKSNDCPYDAYLNGFQTSGDTLTLDIHFTANCCPGFIEEFSFDNDSMSIELIDTLYGCDCICPFDNQFSFHCVGSGDLFFHFRSITRNDWGSWCLCDLDTVITLPE